MSFLPSFSNIVHKLQVEVALFNQLKAGLKESNRKRIPFTITANNAAVVEYVAPFDGSVESIIVACSTATVSTSGNSVTMTVIDKNGATTLLSADTFTNSQELAVNTGTAFFNAGPALSNGGRVKQFAAGDVLTFTALINGTPGPTTASTLNVLLTITPTDPKCAF